MDFSTLKHLIFEDYQRLKNKRGFLISLLWEESFQMTFWFRVGTYLKQKKSSFLLGIVKLIHKHNQHKTGIQILFGTQIEGGLLFLHHGSIVIAQASIIKKNVTIHQGVTIGRVFNGKHNGCPTIGNNVVIFAGAKIVGNVIVGDNAVIGANAVVVNDVPDNAVVAGVPAKILSTDSSTCFDEEWKIFFRNHARLDNEKD